jgi:hypothetical protein
MAASSELFHGSLAALSLRIWGKWRGGGGHLIGITREGFNGLHQ